MNMIDSESDSLNFDANSRLILLNNLCLLKDLHLIETIKTFKSYARFILYHIITYPMWKMPGQSKSQWATLVLRHPSQEHPFSISILIIFLFVHSVYVKHLCIQTPFTIKHECNEIVIVVYDYSLMNWQPKMGSMYANEKRKINHDPVSIYSLSGIYINIFRNYSLTFVLRSLFSRWQIFQNFGQL